MLGLCELQMNKDHDYPNGRTDNQLRVLEHLGMLNVDWYAEARGDIKDNANKPQPGQREAKSGPLLHQPPDAFKHLVNPYDDKQDLTARARSWLHANCSSCHIEAGGGNARIDLEFGTPLDKMRLLRETPLHQTFNLQDAALVAPGAPDKSVLLHRVGIRIPGQMPPLSTNRVDRDGFALLHAWIRGLK